MIFENLKLELSPKKQHIKVFKYFCPSKYLVMEKLVRITTWLAVLYDKIEMIWEGTRSQKIIGSITVLIFVGSVLLTFLNRSGVFPESIAQFFPDKYFSAIVSAFLTLLLFEVFSLIFTLPKSVSTTMLKQFEILSLILLRDVFKKLQEFPEPISWDHIDKTMLAMASNAFGAVLIFGGILIISKLQLHKAITKNLERQAQFIKLKKVLSLSLIVVFMILAIEDLFLFFTHSPTFKFFTTFYTILIFADVLIVLISLRYNFSYMVLFRNSGFALATIMLRVALSAPPILNVALGLTSVVFVMLLTFIYSKFRLREG